MAKLTYRADGHGNTPGSATAILLTSGTNIVSTTPEADPTNSQTVNKGVLERTTDVDVFRFVTGNGPVRLAVNPWIMPSGTRGGNVDLQLELYDEIGTLVFPSNPASQTTTLIQTNLVEGGYFLHIRGSGAGEPDQLESFRSLVAEEVNPTLVDLNAAGKVPKEFIRSLVAQSEGRVLLPGRTFSDGSRNRAYYQTVIDYLADLGMLETARGNKPAELTVSWRDALEALKEIQE